MVFTEMDRDTMKTLCTLAKLSRETDADEEDIVTVGQNLGVPKDTTLLLLEEWEEYDTIRLSTEQEKRKFIKSCFSYMDGNYHANKSEMELYRKVVNTLGLNNTRSN